MSDNGGEFVNGIMKELCHKYQIKKIEILPHHPASNGLVERKTRSILEVLRANVNFQYDNWDAVIPQVQGALNSSYCSTLGETPHHALYGHERRVPGDLWTPPSGGFISSEEFVRDRLRQARTIHSRIREEIGKSMERVTSQRNKVTKSTTIPIGSRVMLRNFMCSKTDPRFVGSFEVISHDGPHAYTLVDAEGNVR